VELQTSSMSDLEPSTPSKHPLHVENPKTLTAQTQQSQQHTHTRKHTHTHTHNFIKLYIHGLSHSSCDLSIVVYPPHRHPTPCLLRS
jgi:hypothetical protein